MEKIQHIFQKKNKRKRLYFDLRKGTVRFSLTFDNATVTVEKPPIYFLILDFINQKASNGVTFVEILNDFLNDYITKEELLLILTYFLNLMVIFIAYDTESRRDLICINDNYGKNQNMLIFTEEKVKAMLKLVDRKDVNIHDSQIESDDLLINRMKFYIPYIKSMLTNLGPITLERLYSVLQRFIQGASKFTNSIDQLDLFMKHLLKEGIVTFNEKDTTFSL